MNKNEKKVQKVHVGRCLLALLLCLGVIIPVIGGVMLATSTYFVVQAEGENDTEPLPTPEEVGGPGSMDLNEFLKEHPDAAIHEANASTPVTTVGNDGAPMDPGWFNVKIKLMGEHEYRELFALGNTNGAQDPSIGKSTDFLWDANWKSATGLNSELANNANMFLIFPKAGEISAWKGPKSGGMRWNDLGFVIQGTDYPELYVPFSPQAEPPANMNYGINAAYVGNTRVYNVGTITVKETKETPEGGEEKVDVTYLWVALDKSGDNIVVLPKDDANSVTERVTLVYGPIEYHVNYQVKLDGTDIAQLAETKEGRENLEQAFKGFVNVDFKNDDEDTIVDAILNYVFSYQQDTTKGQTVTNTVTIPDPGYTARVYYTYDADGNRVQRFPEDWGTFNAALGSDPVYTVKTEEWVTDEDENGNPTATDTVTYADIDGTKGPGRYSFSETYSLGDPGTANGDVLVCVEIESKGNPTFDWSTIHDENGVNSTFGGLYWWSEFGSELDYSTSRVRLEDLDKNTTGHSSNSYPGSDKPDDYGKRGELYPTGEYTEDGQQIYRWTLTLKQSRTKGWTLGSYLDNGYEDVKNITAFSLNDNDIYVPTPNEPDKPGGVNYSHATKKSDVTTTGDEISYLYDDNGKIYGKVTVTAKWAYYHHNNKSLNANVKYYIFEVEVYGKHSVAVTDYSEDDINNKKLFGRLYVRTADGVNVQMWKAPQFYSNFYWGITPLGVHRAWGSSYNNWTSLWTSVAVGNNLRYGLDTEWINGIHFNTSTDYRYRIWDEGSTLFSDKHKFEETSVFRYADTIDPRTSNEINTSAIRATTANNINHKATPPTIGYNVRVELKRGYAWPGQNKAGTGGTVSNVVNSSYQNAGIENGQKQAFLLTQYPDGSNYYGGMLKEEWQPKRQGNTPFQRLRDRSWKKAYLDFSAVLNNYEIQYRPGFNDSTPETLNTKGRSDDFNATDTFKDFALASGSMPYSNYTAVNNLNYDPFAYSFKPGYDFITVASAVPQDDRGGATFKYWVLTDANGTPVGLDGTGNNGKGGIVDPEKPATWVTFDTADNLRLSEIYSLGTTSNAGGYFTNDETGKTEILSTDTEGYTFANKYVFYLTAYWNEPLDSYTSFVSANTRADEKKGEEEIWFEGSVYETEFGTETDYTGDEKLLPENTAGTKTDGITEMELVRAIATMHTSLSFEDLLGESRDAAGYALPMTVNKDNIIHNLNQYQKDNYHYEWYTLDDVKNQSYFWPRLETMGVADIWFLDTSGSLTINSTVAGYDLADGLPIKITLIPPVYTGVDEYGQPLAKPVDTDGDGFTDAYNFNDNRFTYIDEEAYFAGEWVNEVGWIEEDEDPEEAYEKHGHVYGHFAGASIPITFTGTGFLGRNDGTKEGFGSDVKQAKDGGYEVKLTQKNIGKTEVTFDFDNKTYTTERYEYSAIVYMKSGESITFPMLPQGTTYRIELVDTLTTNREYSDGYEFAVEDPETSQGWLLDDTKEDGTEEWRRVWSQANRWGLKGATHYESTVGQEHAISETGATTIWNANTDKSNEGNHSVSKDYYDIEPLPKSTVDATLAKTPDGEKLTILQSKKYYIDGDDENDDASNVVLGINAYDNQVIDMVVKGTYTIYLDQYTSAQEANQENEGNWTAADDKGELEVQNFDYLSYVATARNLTNKSQTLKITLKVDTKFLDGTLADRRLAISKINGVEQDWNPQDFENQTVDDSTTEPGEELEETPVGAAEELEEEQEETNTIVKSGKTKVTFKTPVGKDENGADVFTVIADWEYDFENASIIYTIPNVPSGEEVTLTVRTTVPAVNAATDYYASATLEPIDDEDVESLDSNDVDAYVFSNWLRIVARIGSESYNLTPTDKEQVFTYKVTLTETKNDPDHSVSQLIHFMKFDTTDAYGTEHELSTQWTARVLAPGETEEDLGEYEVALTVDKKDEATTEYSFFVNLKHGERVVIYDMLAEPRVDENNDVPQPETPETPEEDVPEATPDETPEGDENGDATEEQDPAPTEAIHQIGYKVEWTNERGDKDAQNPIYSVYSYGLDGDVRKDNAGHGNGNEADNDIYTGTIEDGVDMVVYVYMPSNDLTVSKAVGGKDDDLDRKWEFVITFENGELALYKEYTSAFDLIKENEEPVYADAKPIASDVNTILWNSIEKKETDENGNEVTRRFLTATLYLKHGQQITIESLPQGTTYSIKEGPVLAENEEAPSYSASYVLTDGNVTAPDTDGVHGPYAYDKDKGMTGGSIYVNQKYQNDEGNWVNVVDEDAEVEDGEEKPFKKATNAVAFTNKMSGDLVITKIVPGYVDADSTDFTFEVKLTDANGTAVTDDIPGLTKTDVDGVYTVTMTSTNGGVVTEDGANKDAWVGSVTIKDLPNGTQYEIKETSCGEGHETHYTSSWDSTKKNTGKIDEPINEAICINEKTGKLTLAKVVDGKTGSKIDPFTFTITLKDSAGNALNGEYKVTGYGTTETLTFVDGVAVVELAHGESISIEGLPKGTTYTIVEADEGDYDTTITVDGGTPTDGKTTGDPATVALWSDNNGTGTTVTYTNSREGTTPSGIVMSLLWAIPLLLMAVGGVTAIVVKHRKRAAI